MTTLNRQLQNNITKFHLYQVLKELDTEEVSSVKKKVITGYQ